MTSKPDLRAAFISALAPISGQTGEPGCSDFERTIIDLSALADLYPPAKAKLATLTAISGRASDKRETSNRLCLEAAMTGYPPAVRDLGMLIMMSKQDDSMGAGLLCRAASNGDWVAGFLVLREACRGQYFLSAENLKRLAVQLSNTVPFRTDIQSKISTLPDDLSVLDKTGFSGAGCQHALDASSKTVGSPSVLHAQNPAIRSFDAVLSPMECDYLIAISCASMRTSKVVSSSVGDSVSSGYRTSDGTVLLPHMLEYPAVRMIEQLSTISGFAPQNGEFLSLLRYQPGQEYFPHHDYLDEDNNDYSMVKKCGQRGATLLTYLNDGYDGGETEFPKLDIAYKGKAGDSLYFTNTNEKGNPIVNSLHAGLPVKSGEKWLATLWVREKSFWPWLR